MENVQGYVFILKIIITVPKLCYYYINNIYHNYCQVFARSTETYRVYTRLHRNSKSNKLIIIICGPSCVHNIISESTSIIIFSQRRLVINTCIFFLLFLNILPVVYFNNVRRSKPACKNTRRADNVFFSFLAVINNIILYYLAELADCIYLMIVIYYNLHV